MDFIFIFHRIAKNICLWIFMAWNKGTFLVNKEFLSGTVPVNTSLLTGKRKFQKCSMCSDQIQAAVQLTGLKIILHGLVSVCGKLQLSSWSRSGRKVCVWVVWGGGGFQVATVSHSNASCFRVVLSLVELRWVFAKTPCERSFLFDGIYPLNYDEQSIVINWDRELFKLTHQVVMMEPSVAIHTTQALISIQVLLKTFQTNQACCNCEKFKVC